MRPDRRPIRLRTFDYARPAAYFITLCTHERAWLFGEVHDGVMQLNTAGRVVDEEWQRSETIRAEIVLDAHVVMPNHLHGIVLIVPPGTERDAARDPRGYRVDVWTGTNDGDNPTDCFQLPEPMRFNVRWTGNTEPCHTRISTA